MGTINIAKRINNQLNLAIQNFRDNAVLLPVIVFRKWPCPNRKLLLVGSESSGSTAIANLLFAGLPELRFLEEGQNKWVWEAYREIYVGNRCITDYPKLQLFDAIKVPGFATILPQFNNSFPNSKVIYIVRDPRDFVNSAIKTWKVSSVPELATISWSNETWLGINSTDPVIRLAKRWRTYLRCAEAASNVTFFRYEDFCTDKLGIIEEMAAILEIPFNRKYVVTTQNQQLSHSSVRSYFPSGPCGWQSGMLCPEDISKIESTCRDEMSRWQYNPSLDAREK